MSTQTVKIGEIEIEVSSVSGKYAMIATTLTFRKAGAVIKVASNLDLDRFVRPENRNIVRAAINETRAAVEASEVHAVNKARQAGLDSIEAHQDRMGRIMAVQG